MEAVDYHIIYVTIYSSEYGPVPDIWAVSHGGRGLLQASQVQGPAVWDAALEGQAWAGPRIAEDLAVEEADRVSVCLCASS